MLLLPLLLLLQFLRRLDTAIPQSGINVPRLSD